MPGETTKPPFSLASLGEKKSNRKSEMNQVQKAHSLGEDKTLDKSKTAAPTLKMEDPLKQAAQGGPPKKDDEKLGKGHWENRLDSPVGLG
ncbi:hypothetical protein L596_017951 [Steinernema carpocapsae]|uniref:Uncharacterized protein n=1 Tax=Steinernema carpocapsae TaxID=34508 RepID=A0A4U5N373_STECR|nr:hypothetical protein L596_017951 [Steinernema carpocapsae]